MGLHSKAKDQGAMIVQSRSILRSHGPVSTQELSNSGTSGLRLEFDPIQNGWIRADAVDDFDHGARRAGWPVYCKTSQVTLRAWTLGDAAIFRQLLDNPRLWTHLPNGYPGPITEEGARDLISLSLDRTLHTVQAICMGGQPIGQVRLEFADQDAELSYWLGEPFWGKGLGRKAVSMFVQACFQKDPSLDHMIARVKPANTGSLRILDKVGFIPEGRSNAAPDWIVLRRDRGA